MIQETNKVIIKEENMGSNIKIILQFNKKVCSDSSPFSLLFRKKTDMELMSLITVHHQYKEKMLSSGGFLVKVCESREDSLLEGS